MRKHYLLLVHDQPEHVLRLVDRLDDGDATFWVHLDRRAAVSGWAEVAQHPRVTLVEPRTACLWGTWSLVEATLTLIRAAMASRRAGPLVLLSGQSYPIRPTEDIGDALHACTDRVRMDIWPLEQHWPDNYRDRLDYFCIPMSSAKGDLLLLRPRQEMNLRELVGWARRLTREHGVRRATAVLRRTGTPRPAPPAHPVGGSQWWAMPWDVAAAVLRAHDGSPDLAEFFRWSQYPDESYFQTLVAAISPELAETALPGPTYVDWTVGDGEVPRVLRRHDEPVLRSLPDHVLFARKFRPGASDDVLDLLDVAPRLEPVRTRR